MDILVILIPEKYDEFEKSNKKGNYSMKFIFIDENLGKMLFSKADLEYVYVEQKDFLDEVIEYLNTWNELIIKAIKASHKVNFNNPSILYF